VISQEHNYIPIISSSSYLMVPTFNYFGHAMIYYVAVCSLQYGFTDFKNILSSLCNRLCTGQDKKNQVKFKIFITRMKISNFLSIIFIVSVFLCSPVFLASTEDNEIPGYSTNELRVLKEVKLRCLKQYKTNTSINWSAIFS